jgi:hypothetical protein
MMRSIEKKLNVAGDIYRRYTRLCVQHKSPLTLEELHSNVGRRNTLAG